MIDNIKNVNIAIWVFQKGLSQKEIFSREKKFAKHLSERKYKEYAYTRGYARYVLANLFKLSPSDVPIYSVPSNQPYLEKGWGYLSLSHCDDAILITWSKKKIGVDIERTDRKIPFKKICNRFFTTNEKKIFNNIKGKYQKSFVLENWVMKESAFKCQSSKVPSDIFKWEWDRSINICSNYRTNEKLKFNLIKYKIWTIGVASNFLDLDIPLIICSNIN